MPDINGYKSASIKKNKMTAEQEMKELGIIKVIFEDGEWRVETEDTVYYHKSITRILRIIREDRLKK